MKLLKEIYETNVGIKSKNSEISYKIRKAARAILFNNKNEIAILYVSKDKYHKLPGGGVKKGEDIQSTLSREVMEETGCGFKASGEVGAIIEYHDKLKELQISYCFVANVAGSPEKPQFTKSEKDDGFVLKWMALEEAISTQEKGQPKSYYGKFIKIRDLEFLLKAKANMGH